MNYDAIAKRAADELGAAPRTTSGRGLTVQNLLSRAEDAIEGDEHFIYDVADDVGQMVDNVKHMRWFRNAVANWLIENTEKWSHLPPVD